MLKNKLKAIPKDRGPAPGAQDIEPSPFCLRGLISSIEVYFHNATDRDFSMPILERLLSDDEMNLCAEMKRAGHKKLYVLGQGILEHQITFIQPPHDQVFNFCRMFDDIAALATKEKHMDNKVLAILHEIVSNSRNKN